MYLREVHADLDIPALYKFIQENPLGVLTTAIKHPTYPLLQSTHIPWVLDIPPPSTDPESPKAILRGHLALANPHTKAILALAASTEPSTGPDGQYNGTILEDEVLILFTSTTTHYVTPKFYVESKPLDGKVVPTWNYAAVQAYGKLRIFGDSKAESSKAFLAKQLDDLSRLCEEDLMHYDGKDSRAEAWTVDESPVSYVSLLKKAIVGVEIEVFRLEGKWKMSQELSEADRVGTVEGFEAIGTSMGCKMAEMVKERGCMREAVVKARKEKKVEGSS